MRGDALWLHIKINPWGEYVLKAIVLNVVLYVMTVKDYNIRHTIQ
jgi:hypothetical protein